MAETPMLDRDAIASRIPHAGRMVLLDAVSDWDAHTIRCTTRSHLDIGNPLREPAGLPVWAGIEYAAQAAALHASLLRGAGPPRRGLLASIRDARSHCECLDGIEGELVVNATLGHASAAGAIYEFRLLSAARVLISGRVLLIYEKEPR